jgi:hypothetical protein
MSAAADGVHHLARLRRQRGPDHTEVSACGSPIVTGIAQCEHEADWLADQVLERIPLQLAVSELGLEVNEV